MHVEPELLDAQIAAFLKVKHLLEVNASEEDVHYLEATGQILTSIAVATQEALADFEQQQAESGFEVPSLQEQMTWGMEQHALIIALELGAETLLKQGDSLNCERIKALASILRTSLEEEEVLAENTEAN